MSEDIAEIARRLAEQAEAVCRRYLPAGRREGRQWRVGDVRNAPGRSLFVRLSGPTSGKDAAGRWRDAATGESGDLIDLIQSANHLPTLAEALAEGRRFLSLPKRTRRHGVHGADRYDPMASVARLVAESRPIAGTLAETYLRHRGIDCDLAIDALRFHPQCPYRDPDANRYVHWPALLSLVTDLEGGLTGLQRTYLSPDGDGKADVSAPRRSLGGIRRHGARFGEIHDVGVFGEGVETVLSLKRVLPKMPMVATLSADNLGASAVPGTLRRLYVAVDADAAGRKAATTLSERLASTTLRILRLQPNREDFNADLMNDGVDALRRGVAPQLLPEDLHLLE